MSAPDRADLWLNSVDIRSEKLKLAREGANEWEDRKQEELGMEVE